MINIKPKIQKSLNLLPTIGHHNIHFEEIDSTNLYATSLLSKTNPIHGTVISASFQHSGIGQFGRTWLSSRNKNILCSIILTEGLPKIEDQFYLSAAVAISLQQLISKYVNDIVTIKWPNDIYIGNKKIAGILIQNSITGTVWKNSVVGIGINVNEDQFNNLASATSIFNESKTIINIHDFKKNLFQVLDENYQVFISKTKEDLLVLYQNKLFLKNILSNYTIDQQTIKASIVGINKFGQLLLNIDGNVRSFSNGEVKYLI
jgi:BirA family biotin operon repressor/biotin-[acetyl-CoA-carboxylase] ligase